MKRNNQQHRRSSVIAALKGGMLSAGLMALSAGPAGAEGVGLTMTATATQGGACTVDVSPAALDLGSIKASDIVGSGGAPLVSPMQKTTVSLKNCGLGETGVAPVVTISGDHPSSEEISPTSSGRPYLFKTSGNAFRYWIVAASKQISTYDQASLYGDFPAGSANAEKSQVITGKGGESGDTRSKDVWLGVTCAAPTYCSSTQSGGLKATFHFTFAYQ